MRQQRPEGQPQGRAAGRPPGLHRRRPGGGEHLPELLARDDDALVGGDADELRSVLSNLLDNAVKYSPAPVQVSVDVSTPSPEMVRVQVRDQGVGIPSSSPGRCSTVR